MRACPCCQKAAPSGYLTCGDSLCQEAVYQRLRAATVRSKTERALAAHRAVACERARDREILAGP